MGPARGAVNPGERVEAAACRELSEETGLQLDVKNVTLLGVFSGPEHQHTYPDSNTVDWVTVVYQATLVRTSELQAGDDAAEARFWPLGDLPQPLSAATPFYLQTLFRTPGAGLE
ncbi:NUDIX domain-containing protein [Deinococcus malanensis]|uniref:NUDIX domain-containing protein n=1 Tax=Deinococcus malanensis TaxID=1706855 RepID=UPI00363EFC0C